jgi:hypothetical protein
VFSVFYVTDVIRHILATHFINTLVPIALSRCVVCIVSHGVNCETP